MTSTDYLMFPFEMDNLVNLLLIVFTIYLLDKSLSEPSNVFSPNCRFTLVK